MSDEPAARIKGHFASLTDPCRRKVAYPLEISGALVTIKVSRHETVEKGRGRSEHRTYYVCDVPEDLPDRTRWKGLKRIGPAVSDTVRDGKPCDEVRYFISSKKKSARRFGAGEGPTTERRLEG